MISRDELEAIKGRYMRAREQAIGSVNAIQGSIDAVSALITLWDEREQENLAAAVGSAPDEPAKGE